MNDYSLGTNKRGSMAENSFLIVEDSFDALTENKNNQLVQENEALKAKLNQVKSVLPVEQCQ